MPKARDILSGAAMGRALARIATEILERNGGLDGLALLGIPTRGVPLALRLARLLERSEGVTVPTGALDITLHRDDLLAARTQPTVHPTHVPFEVDGLTVVLVDDVLFTGRTARAALDALLSLGRPRRIQLAVLVDRGHRELPIAADYVGRAVETASDEQVRVHVKEHDGSDRVSVVPAGEAA